MLLTKEIIKWMAVSGVTVAAITGILAGGLLDRAETGAVIEVSSEIIDPPGDIFVLAISARNAGSETVRDVTFERIEFVDIANATGMLGQGDALPPNPFATHLDPGMTATYHEELFYDTQLELDRYPVTVHGIGRDGSTAYATAIAEVRGR